MGTCCFPEEVSKRLTEELVEGRELTNQLKNILEKQRQEDGLVSADELLLKIWTCFTESLSVLKYSNYSVQSGGDEVCQIKSEPSHLDHSHCDERSLEDSSESQKRPPAASNIRDRRGCYTRRKTSHTSKVVSTTMEDGQAWRKYGQKEILNATYPRSYFRCTRKYDEGCRATKQVQQIEANPRKYEITYIGQHTCANNNIRKTAPQMSKDSDDWKPYIISFDTIIRPSITATNKTLDHYPLSSSSTSVVIKEEEKYKEETTTTAAATTTTTTTTPSDQTDNLNNTSLDTNYLCWSDLDGFGFSAEPTIDALPNMLSENDQSMVSMMQYCREVSFQNLDMDFVVKSLDDVDYLRIDEPLSL